MWRILATRIAALEVFVSTQLMNAQLTSFIGLDEPAAQALATDHRLQVRVLQRDDDVFSWTREWRDDRINLRFKSGKVYEAHLG
jgi:hypothetical protein